jgi:conjugal transfer/entry exclusion protein
MLLVAGLSLPLAVPQAAVPVIDVGAIAQLILSVQQRVTQITRLTRQVEQFNERINQARQDLEKLGVVIRPELKTQITQYLHYIRTTLKTLRGRRFDLNQAMAAYQEIYAQAAPTLGEVVAWRTQADEAVQDAFQMEAIVVSGIDNGHEIIGKLLNLLMDSGGNLQALQAMGQHQVTTNEQLQQLRAEQAMSGRRELAIRAMELAESKRAHDLTMESAKGLLVKP